MTRPALALGRGVLAGAALAASFGSLGVQLGFAILAIGVIGMAHGASDLAVVPPPRRRSFLGLYGAVSLICLAWWSAFPAIALPLFLIASALHFAAEEDAAISRLQRGALGVGLIAIPAVLHPQGYEALLTLAVGMPVPSPVLAALIAAGGVAGGLLFLRAGRRRDPLLAITTAALFLLPPLVGFSVGFLLLHALPQTDERRRRMGCASHRAYLRRTGPILIAAVLLAGLVVSLFLHVEASGIRGLFAAIAALAMPHLLVTPAFGRDRTHVRPPCPRNRHGSYRVPLPRIPPTMIPPRREGATP